MIDAPTEALAGRYHFLAPFRYQEDTPRWLARDERTGERVVVALVERTLAAKLEVAKGFAHPHLAALVDAIHAFPTTAMPGGNLPTDGVLLVAEYVAGPTLRHALAEGRINPARAVAWWLRLVQATAEVHRQGGVLSGISPFGIVTKAEGRAVPPVLTRVTAPAVGATLSPERLRGNVPDPTDDVWALYATLYWALTGVQPYPASTREGLLKDIAGGPPTPLSAFGIKEPELEEIIKRGLNGDPAQRALDIEELGKSLDAWERGLNLPPRPKRKLGPRSLSGIVKGGLTPSTPLGRVVFAEAGLPREFGVELPNAAQKRRNGENGVREPAVAGDRPSPSGALSPAAWESSPAIETTTQTAQVATLPKRPSVNPFAKKRAAWPLLVGMGLLLGAGVAFFSFSGSSSVAPAASAVALGGEQPTPASASSASPELASPPMTPTQSRNACIMSYFSEGTFEPAAQLGFVCDAGDHRDITSKLHELAEATADREARRAAAAAALPEQQEAEAGFQVDTLKVDAGPERVRRPLGWYELLATAVIRKGCCPNAAPVTLPETTGWCEQLQDVVRDLADDSARSGDLAPRVRRFDKAVDCLFANRVRRPYEQYKQEAINESNRSAFQQFLSHAAVSDARRRTLGQ